MTNDYEILEWYKSLADSNERTSPETVETFWRIVKQRGITLAYRDGDTYVTSLVIALGAHLGLEIYSHSDEEGLALLKCRFVEI